MLPDKWLMESADLNLVDYTISRATQQCGLMTHMQTTTFAVNKLKCLAD